MLKYCEVYRTMRESLCREQSREHLGRGDADGRSDQGVEENDQPSCITLRDGFSSQARVRGCHIFKDGASKSTGEDVEVLEKQSRRQSVSYDNEFTFSPRLNLTSVRMAKERSGRAHEAVARRTTAGAVEAEQNFTFKPKVSSKSEKIAQGLKTSFFERQLIHVEKQKKKLGPESVQVPQLPHPRLSPVMRPTKHRKQLKSELSKSERLQCSDKINNGIEKTTSTRSAPDCISAATKHETSASGLADQAHKMTNHQVNFCPKTHGDEDFAQKSPHTVSVENLTLKRSRQAVMRHKRIKTYPGASTVKESVSENMDEKEDVTANEGHKRSVTVPGHCSKNQYHNIPSYLRLRMTKMTAENAIKDNKIFVCHGPYPVVRASLRKRGWVEKHFKGCPAVTDDSNKKSLIPDLQEKQNSNENREDIPGESDKKQQAVKREKQLSNSNDGNDEDNDYEFNDSTIWNAGYEGEDCEYSVLSRFCRNATASFFWTCKRDDIDFKYLRKDQIANHFSKAYSFTTKVGLCSHLRNLSWFEEVHSDTFFPRCHRISSDEEKEDFIDDYRITSACNILKLVMKRSQDEQTSTIPSFVKPKSSYSVRRGSSCRLNRVQDVSQPRSQRSRSSSAVRDDSSLIGQVPSRAVTLALQACQEFIMSRKNEDIDECSQCLTDEDWEELIGYYYQIIHNNRITIEGAQSVSGKCQEMLEEMRQYLPQLDLDGVRNVWIIKPGAKSRGRGIMCMDRLQDILKLVSSTVKKENRWIVQKYIESPLLIYNTKFDIRQWFLVTDWNPLTLWFYKDCYFRFCSQEFTLENFEPCIHLANNSIQKHYQNGVRDERLPENNMWSSDDFREYLRQKGKGNLWEEVIYPGMRQAIVYALESCQITLEARKNSFELYGADFMLTEDYKPWLIEINSSPAMSASTTVTRKLCANVIEDTMKVVLDRREDKNCDTGRFELAFKQPYIDSPPYIGINLTVNGKGIITPSFSQFRRQTSGNRLQILSKPREKRSRTMEVMEHKVETEDDGESKQDAENKDVREAVLVKLREKSFVLNREDIKDSENVYPSKATKQTRCPANGVSSKPNIEFSAKPWRSFDATNIEKPNLPKVMQLRTLNIKPNIVPSQKKKTFGNNFVKSSNRLKIAKERKVARTDHIDSDYKLSPRVITIPDVGVPKTILRYTDKKFRVTRTVPIEMGPETKLRKDPGVVK